MVNKKYIEMLRGVIPAIVFMIVYEYVSFMWAVIVGVGIGIFIYGMQYYRNKRLTSFSYLGIFGLIIQTIISLVAKNPLAYFIYPMISSLVFSLVFGISLFLKMDAISFFARDMSSSQEWFEKLRPVYRKLTVLWAVFFVFKAIVRLMGILNWSFEVLYLVNWIMGTPMQIFLLWLSFEYPRRYARQIMYDQELEKNPSTVEPHELKNELKS